MNIDMQAYVNGLSAQWQKERSETQLTLGAMIEALKAMPADAPVANLCESHSYRGYYSDLAFERGQGNRTAGELLAECQAAMGQVFEGYKGGDFVMGARTPVWVACYGCCGQKLMSIRGDGSIETAEDD